MWDSSVDLEISQEFAQLTILEEMEMGLVSIHGALKRDWWLRLEFDPAFQKKKRIRPIKCFGCGKSFTTSTRQDQFYCTTNCRQRMQMRIRRETRRTLRVFTCIGCGKETKTWFKHVQIFCTRKCSRRVQAKEYRRRKKERSNGSKNQGTCQEAGNDAGNNRGVEQAR